jgi:periplasmic protein CpxP/Spy
MEGPNEAKADATSRGWRRRILYGLLGGGALAALVSARPIAAAVQGGWHRMGMGHGGWGLHGRNPEAMREHVQLAAKWALREVDATEEQQQRVGAIVSDAFEDLMRLKERHQANHEVLAAALAGPTVDRARLEEARKSGLALADEATRRLAQAAADAAEVLTPEQRQALLEHVKRHHEN